jgi:hypothetical protein
MLLALFRALPDHESPVFSMVRDTRVFFGHFGHLLADASGVFGLHDRSEASDAARSSRTQGGLGGFKAAWCCRPSQSFEARELKDERPTEAAKRRPAR